MFKRYLIKVAILAAALFAFSLLLFAGHLDSLDAEMDHKHYCEMVKIYKETDGRLGWPKFEGECK